MGTKKQNNKIIIFDWGGIVESNREGEYNIYKARIKLIKQFNNSIDEKELLEKYAICYNEQNIRAYREPVEIEKWFYRIKKDLELSCKFEEFCEAYKKEYSKVYYYKETAEFAHSLRELCQTGILSNLTVLDKERIDYQMKLDKFDYVWLSFEIGVGKPDKKIYEFVENECKIPPENILFIDDRERNIIAAKERGWNVLQAYGYELDKIKERVHEFLNK